MRELSLFPEAHSPKDRELLQVGKAGNGTHATWPHIRIGDVKFL
jgi:hypothetical protein